MVTEITHCSGLTGCVWNCRNDVLAFGSQGPVVGVVVVMPMVVVVPRSQFCGIRGPAVLLNVERVQVAVVQRIAAK